VNQTQLKQKNNLSAYPPIRKERETEAHIFGSVTKSAREHEIISWHW